MTTCTENQANPHVSSAVTGQYKMPGGGGYEMQFSLPIPPEFVKVRISDIVRL